METTLESKKIGNYTINVGYDECPENPRDFDEIAIIYSNHKRLNPDNHSIEELLDEDGYLNMEGKIGLMVWLFEHSNYTFKTTELEDSNPFGNGVYARFDSGQFGVIAMDIEVAKTLWKDEWETMAKQHMQNAIKDYNAFANGNIYSYEITAGDGTAVDYSGGFYDVESALENGELVARFFVKCNKDAVTRTIENNSFDELKSQFCSFVPSAPAWVDELWALIDEGKAKAWLVEQLKALMCEE